MKALLLVAPSTFICFLCWWLNLAILSSVNMSTSPELVCTSLAVLSLAGMVGNTFVLFKLLRKPHKAA
jgi:hypothetical protein